ncbi:MAG TPA: SRPBCC family protein [Gammaproteobacteria bacterium]|nr:SRPBCC family protein [Gammaproteobacteria bacterium]
MKHTVFTSSVIDAPVDEVWALVRDFNALPQWHPVVSESTIEAGHPGDRVGCVRHFVLVTGESVRERLMTLCDISRICSYSLLDGPLPVRDYVASLQLRPVTDGNRTYIDWRAEFSCAPDDEMATRLRIGTIFQDGFDALKRHFESRDPVVAGTVQA